MTLRLRSGLSLAAMTMLCALACKDAAHLSGTAVLIRVELSGLAPDQLRYTGTLEGTGVFGPTLRPETAGEQVSEFSSVRVLLPDALAGQTIDVRVEALTAGTVVGEGLARVQVERGVERLVNVVLNASDAGTGCTGCPGCCDNGRCLTPSAAACGISASSCVRCNDTTADGCRADGQCGCGLGPTCTSAIGADRCTQGECHCGTGPACGPGTECLFGACQCTTASCAGCCEGGQCLTGDAVNACGRNGMACLECGATACTGGVCGTATCNATNCAGCCSGAVCLAGDAGTACGVGGEGCTSCGTGLCTNGSCVGACGPATCAGCCENGVCQPGTSASACGKGGSICSDCGAGTCTASSVCTGGCTPTSCPNGCCSAGTCVTGNSAQTCGASGTTCFNCGTGSCDAGQCVPRCSAATCPNGCCDDTGECRAKSTATCGTNGSACVACPANTTDSCPAASCRCGTQAACGPGLACVGGACVCNTTSCAGCCNAQGTQCLTGDGKQSCGSGGMTCMSCTGGARCENHVCQ